VSEAIVNRRCDELANEAPLNVRLKGGGATDLRFEVRSGSQLPREQNEAVVRSGLVWADEAEEFASI
jgi:hypothetical protein